MAMYYYYTHIQCILAYPNLDYPNPCLSELQINEILSLSITKHIISFLQIIHLQESSGPKEFR